MKTLNIYSQMDLYKDWVLDITEFEKNAVNSII